MNDSLPAATVTEPSEVVNEKKSLPAVLKGGVVSSQQSADSYDYGAPIEMVRLRQSLVAGDASRVTG